MPPGGSVPVRGESTLPPGQRAAPLLPFGLPEFAGVRAQPVPGHMVTVGGATRTPTQFRVDELLALGTRRDQRSDLHCVTTWSSLRLSWAGVSFAEVHAELTALVRPHPKAGWVRFTGLDGYRATMRLDDTLAADVLLADRLDGADLTDDHGAPLRLVAPAHYGYKSVKRLCAIDYLRDYDPGPAGWLGHPRGRVWREERGRYLPGRIWRGIWPGRIEQVRALYRRDSGIAG
ncbi:molybdopterin-dependent oxidoreductase [Nocardia sp. NPDC050710]|uniref:molybdopterin-dependent oxidoreductase n=1 Tax=Nocardia sp. NPDC050710 TaxID=3157220 RepID=UPI0033FA18E4